MRADIVLCCGDMGDKANLEGLQYVWREVNKLKTLLGADLVLGTAGNHDMDSRHVYNDYDVKGQIQALAACVCLAYRVRLSDLEKVITFAAS